MSDEKTWKDGRIGSFLISRRYKERKLEAEVGRLYEAHHVDTGASALVLIPGAAHVWEPEETWVVRASSQAEPPHVVLEVEQAPASGQLRSLVKLLELLAAALSRVEGSVHAREHLLDGTWARLMRKNARWLWLLNTWIGPAALCFAVIVLGLRIGLGIGFSGGASSPGDEVRAAHGVAMDALLEADAPTLIDKPASHVELLAYPLPSKPFRNQAKAPCKPKEGEVEINGGCWVELAKLPPCFENQAEYQGKCYLPVSARSREPQALQP